MDMETKKVCSNCANLKYWKQEETDCCFYALYKCAENKKEIIDDFHIDYKKCRNYKPKKVKNENNEINENENK